MKTAWRILPLLLLAGAGCLEIPVPWRDAKPADPRPSPIPVQAPRPPDPVTADQVTEANAHAKAKALDEEIARDEQGDVPAADAVQPSSDKP
jgi:hypothetical protein